MYLIVGANGFVGSYAIKNILEKTKEEILAVDKDILNCQNTERISWMECDITKHNDIVKLNERCSNESLKIIYLAAYHKPDLVLANPRIAWNINITCMSDFINTMENVKSLFFASTEMVYKAGDLDTFFKEGDPKEPVNAYGNNKSVAESLITGYGYNVVRFPFMIGPSILNHKNHFYDVIVETITSGKTIDMFEDAYKTPLDFDTAIGAVIDLAEKHSPEMPKIINIAGDEVMTKYEIGLRIARKYNCSEDLIVPISVTGDNKIFIEKRADITLMDNSLLKQVLGLKELKMKF